MVLKQTPLFNYVKQFIYLINIEIFVFPLIQRPFKELVKVYSAEHLPESDITKSSVRTYLYTFCWSLPENILSITQLSVSLP